MAARGGVDASGFAAPLSAARGASAAAYGHYMRPELAATMTSWNSFNAMALQPALHHVGPGEYISYFRKTSVTNFLTRLSHEGFILLGVTAN
jgi:hypothetical protein